ncbi:MAG TPA: YebC/PmpR family DNA-binding transcriptional regulator, partial [Planctomycetota bacterium]|nr:YebC/PmpR family DNA-binding transcriptional regulator [Planctomycetota bacterium]
MAGHSKWANIQHRKAAVDKKKGVAFSKAAKGIMSAVKQGGPDPDKNLKLKYAIEAAREVNMPRENIERAIKRASGEGADALEEVVYEG